MRFSIHAASREAQWKQVQDAVNKGLPKTAITNLEPIIQGALKDRAYAEAVKAIAQKIALEGNIQGNKPEEKIVRLEAEIAKAPPEMKPVLDTILAHWYWQYFQQNRWRFLRRTSTAAQPGKDFTTWDLPRLFEQIDRQFEKALAAEKVLKSTPIAAWNDLLVKGTMPDSYRPTLYDFIAHEALQFYTSGEMAMTKAEGAFEVSADSAVFDDMPSFIQWQPVTTDTNATAFKAIRLFQQLLRFHESDAAPQLALVDVDLERLTWAGNTAVGEDKQERYRAALERFIAQNSALPISARALAQEAQLLRNQDDLAGAHQLAEKGAKAFPGTPGGNLCLNILGEIESKSAQITTERVWNCFSGATNDAPCPVITIHYRNLETVFFRAIPYDWEIFLQKRYHRPESLSPAERREILSHPVALQWSEKLAPTTDYKEKARELPAPTNLKPGFYFIAASHDPKFGETENMVSMADVWVSDLALVTRSRDGLLEGFVLDANSGEPLAAAEISIWHLDQTGNRVSDPGQTTDENGLFSFKSTRNYGYLLRARYQGRELGSLGDLYAYNWQPEIRPAGRTIFFTDRAIYRPGQMIQYKGICVWVDQDKDNYEVLKGESLTVVFRDVNGKEIARQKQRANEYGSFAGSFTAPRDRLMGAMTLQVEGRAQGATSLRVEEYKRPKFMTTLDAPKIAAKLNEKVAMTGHATSYTGAAVDAGQVSYRVVRQVRMPPWWGWWRGIPRPGESQEIAHGTTQTGIDGSFSIEFIAKPDLKVLATNEPTFVFEINADVTDSAGETRSAERSIRVGYTALEANVEANDWQTADKPVELKLATTTLDSEGQAAEGMVKVYGLQGPAKVQRASLGDQRPFPLRYYQQGGSEETDETDSSDPKNWPLGKLVAERPFQTDTNGSSKVSVEIPAGAYRVVLETQDRFGKKVTARHELQVLEPAATRLAIKVPHLVAAPSWEMQPGDDFIALWGTGYDTGRAFVEIEQRHKLTQRYWTKPGQTQQQIQLAVSENMRGGFTVHVTQIRENRAYLDSHRVSVPWKNKELDLKWEHFVSKLQPGQKETWTLVVNAKSRNGKSSSSAERAVAELAATLYDESLDAFAPRQWPERFDVFRQDSSSLQPQFANCAEGFQHLFGQWAQKQAQVDIRYRSFPPELTALLRGYQYFRAARGFGRSEVLNEKMVAEAEPSMMSVPKAAPAAVTFQAGLAADTLQSRMALPPAGGAPEPPAPPKPDLAQVTARQNLNETAFFYPQLTTDSNGVVRMTFTMPEALTKWRFMGFAHDRELRSGYLDGHTVTAKDLMVQPNPPRFLREGDTVEFTVKISNQSETVQEGTVRLTFAELGFGSSSNVDAALGNTRPEQSFSVPAKQSRSVSWRISVPDGCGFLSYKAVAAAANVSDGEEGAIPVLSRRILVTESLPLPIRGPATKKFEFTRLVKSGSSKTLQNQSLTVQMVSNPAWYAVLALPYLMEYPYECSEQIFNRLYANTLARKVAGSDPKIHRVFEQWRNTPALDSPLEKNQDLKGVTLEETPWLRQAQSESQARRNVGILFDDNRVNYEIERTRQKLAEMQLPDGSWPWFPGGQGNDYITLYITTGFGRLRQLGAEVDVSLAIRSLHRLDAWMNEEYDRIQERKDPEKYVPSSIDALYLYGRSFFLKEQPIAPPYQKAIDFFLGQARKFWLETNCRQTQAQLALALQRFSSFSKPGTASDNTSAAIMASLRERSVSNEEMGMFWRDTELSWWWYRAPIETQALMIEAFDEVAHDNGAVEECKVWLLKQKQTRDWKTTKATADAVYALLLRGADLLASDALVDVRLDGIDITPNQSAKSKGVAVEPGTGFYEVRFTPAEIKPKLGDITVKKSDPGVAWGSMHWQYLEDMTKVTPYAGTPLKLKKEIFVKTRTGRGPVLEAAKGALQVGAELVVRIELRVDRDMEYVHLKDERGSGTEPMNVLSRYRYQDGLAYYESTRDTASHFFIDYLPKGTYVFEYSTRIQLRGRYQNGVAEIQCMYAPEFNSHSESFELEVK